jgi:hypothetical protein
MGLAQHPAMQRTIEEHVTALRDMLDATAFADGWAEGAAMSPDEAITYALDASNDQTRVSSSQ